MATVVRDEVVQGEPVVGGHEVDARGGGAEDVVAPGDPVPDRPESGQVKFYDPRGPVFMHVDPGNERLEPRYTATPVYLEHRAGQLVIFPSWLMHEVLPYLGRSERIVVAFNAWMSRGD